MTICLKTSSAGSASEGFSDIHAETARMSGITNRVLRPVPDAEARRPIRGRHNLRYAIEKPWVETRGFFLAGGWVAGWVRCRGIGGFLLPWQDKSYVPLSADVRERHFSGKKQKNISPARAVQSGKRRRNCIDIAPYCGILLQR